ncbi:CHAT domain-containing protein [Mycena rosella]|uniref:CHAT domain-containing protein n=1 Tax=Mycena rosella TaxID=1033263 RepID=A0AAD7CQ20_MYCRO|nr:CHAT domain-containing protein [Mycena rosella]
MENNTLSSTPGTRADSQASTLYTKDTTTVMFPAVQVDPGNKEASGYFNMAHSSLMECRTAANIPDLESAIFLFRCAAHSFHAKDPQLKECEDYLATALLTRFTHVGEADDVLNAFCLHASAHGFPMDDPFSGAEPSFEVENPNENMILAVEILASFHQALNLEILAKTITLYRETLMSTVVPHPQRWRALLELSEALLMQFFCSHDMAQARESVSYMRQGVLMQPNLSVCLVAALLASAHIQSAKMPGDPYIWEAANCLNKALDSDQKALTLSQAGHNFVTVFQQSGDVQDINDAVANLQQATSLLSWGHASRGSVHGELAVALNLRFQQKGDFKDLEEAIELHRAALALLPTSHPDHCSSLSNLAGTLQTCFSHKGDFKDLDEAIELHKEVISFSPATHPNIGSFLNNCARAFLIRFEQRGDLEDLEEAIELHRKVLVLLPSPHPDHSCFRNNLADALAIRFKQKGDFKDLEEAIGLDRGALVLCPAPHPHHSGSLQHLAMVLETRFKQRGDFKDLEEAIELHRAALALCPSHGDYLNNLAGAVQERFEQKNDIRDLEEAIKLHRAALTLCPAPHSNRGTSLSNLAVAVKTRFQQKGDLKDLEEAIGLLKESLKLYPASHPNYGGYLNNLARVLETQFKQKGDIEDLEEAVKLYREALELFPAPHPDRGTTLTNLGCLLADRYRSMLLDDDLNASMLVLQEASTYLYSSPLKRLHHTHTWARIAAQHGHSSALAAYCSIIDLLPQIAALHLDVVSRQSILTDYNGAVKLLEASRSIFWSQALHLRTQFNLLKTTDPKLAFELKRLAKELEIASFRDTSRPHGPDNQEKVIAIEAAGAQYRQVNKDWDTLIQSARLLPGFEDFMQPKSIKTLRQAAVSGPIIILSASNSTCSALIVTLSEDVQHVCLPSRNRQMVETMAELFHALAKDTFDINSFLANRLHGKDSDSTAWSEFIARLFGAQEGSVNKSTQPHRVWWCPTGPFSSLPIHAAGIYTKDSTDCVTDYIVSSYTPTLTALLEPPIQPLVSFKMTAVIEPNAPNCSPLPGTKQELEKILNRVPNQWLTSLLQTTRIEVVKNLQESSMVHFACHGIQDSENPLDSSLMLSDGRLKVSQIMRRQESDYSEGSGKPMSLAFLSACETAKGDNSTPDEAMHLAATFLFAGFRGVVATMWSIEDQDGPKIADAFYEHLFKDCSPDSVPPVLPDLTKAAEALHIAIEKLRKEPDMATVLKSRITNFQALFKESMGKETQISTRTHREFPGSEMNFGDSGFAMQNHIDRTWDGALV